MLVWSPIPRMDAWSRQRGFTLVELAIALAVVGLVLGATLIPLRALDEVRQLRDEQRQMEAVRDAVVGYALRHRTRARTIRFVFLSGGIGSFHVRPIGKFRLPAGRPYLPCPDWNGDGFEDRMPEGAGGFAQGMEVRPAALPVTATLTSLFSTGLFLYWFQTVRPAGEASTFATHSRPYGECRVSRGAVPWRTLGVSPSDGWGNRRTYFVDPVFSNAIFGFDRQTIADLYDPRIPEAIGLIPSQRDRRPLTDNFDNLRPRPLQGYDCPSAVCDGGRSFPGDCVAHNLNAHLSRTTRHCGWTRPTVILKAGASTREEINDGRKRYPAGSVTDGLPFVLVSHGPNGRFAVNHWASLDRPADTRGVSSPICNFSWAGRETVGPFLSYAVHPDELALAHEAVNGARLSPSHESCPPVHRSADTIPEESLRPNLSFFVWEPPGLGEPLGTRARSGFDDLLLWMTREELSLAVPGRIPPLPRMVVAYFP